MEHLSFVWNTNYVLFNNGGKIILWATYNKNQKENLIRFVEKCWIFIYKFVMMCNFWEILNSVFSLFTTRGPENGYTCQIISITVAAK